MHEALRTDDASVVAMLDRRDLVLVTGKGGTGKSTVVAALAEIAAARRGHCLAVEISAHPRLPTILGPESPVQTLNLVAEEVVAKVLARLLGFRPLVSAVVKNRVVRQFIQTSPAVRETILLDELRFHVERLSREGCPVIVDLPASGHAMSFLDTARSVRRMLRVGPVATAAARVEELLLDRRRCELVVVALPEELPINETIELLRHAAELGIACRRVVVNQVPVQALEPHERPLLEVIQKDEGTIGRFARAAHGDSEGADQARAQIERLRTSVPAQLLELPRCASNDPRACIDTLKQALQQ
jgi:anion-transporting  ArsA/GET3 family ATPase